MDVEPILEGHRERLLPLSLLVLSLLVIYGIYLGHLIGANATHDPDPIPLGTFLGKVLIVSAIGGAPFAVMAYADAGWHSRNAAQIAVGCWVAVFAFFAARHGAQCPLVAIFLFIPLTFGALAGHAIGALRHP
jgi:hypothetical protein